ncbi:MAG: hypothetical protein JNM85_01775 [Chthonomonas sp.]|nr:hypothetical protein [Chthonomonas sp.]
MKLNPSTKIAIGFAATLGLGYAAFRAYSGWYLGQLQLAPIKPGTVNLIAVQPGKRYRIVVANQIAQLVEGGETGPESEQKTDNDTGSGSERRRVPIREMLKTLAGEEKALSALVMKMNDITDDILPPVRVIWTAEDLKKALDGDAGLTRKLEADLNIKLDGTPLDQFTISSIENGIVLDVPVDVKVQIEGKPTVLTARVLQTYRPTLCRVVSDRLKDSPPDISEDAVRGLYLEEARRELAKDPKQRENVRGALARRIDPKHNVRLGDAPQTLLQATTTVVNESHLAGASVTERDAPNNRKFYDITINLTKEGRDRLWKYSHDQPGFQLLFVVDGIAIAAPKIAHEMMSTAVTISQVQDKTLAEDAVARINAFTQSGGKS